MSNLGLLTTSKVATFNSKLLQMSVYKVQMKNCAHQTTTMCHQISAPVKINLITTKNTNLSINLHSVSLSVYQYNTDVLRSQVTNVVK